MKRKLALGPTGWGVATSGLLALLAAIYFLWPAGATHYWTPSDLLHTPPAALHADALDKVQELARGLGRQPVALAVEPPGSIYAGSLVVAYTSGNVVRLSADGSQFEALGNTGGRPFAVALTLNGDLFIADARRGLLKLDGGHFVQLYDGQNVEGVAVSRTGTKIYFTRWSRHFSWQQIGAARFAHDESGTLMSYDTKTGQVKTIAGGLSLPRGVVSGPKGDYVLVAESGNYRIVRVWLDGTNMGRKAVFASGLPGFPDGISFNGFGRFWVAVPTQRIPELDQLAHRSIYRRFLLRLPRGFRPRIRPVHKPCVLGFDLAGHRIAELRGEGASVAAPAYGPVNVAVESGPWLWLGSEARKAVARIPLQRILKTAPSPLPGWHNLPGRARQVD